MKIRKVKWANHPILGNLELNFINPTTNKPYSANELRTSIELLINILR